MNKRQKKKREKKIAWDADYKEYLAKQKTGKIERYGIDFNNEGYRDSTAAAAIKNVMKDEGIR